MVIARVLSFAKSFGKKGIPVVATRTPSRALLDRRRIEHHTGKPIFQPTVCMETLGKEEVTMWLFSRYRFAYHGYPVNERSRKYVTSRRATKQ